MKHYFSILCCLILLFFSVTLNAETKLLDNSFDSNPLSNNWIREGDDLLSVTSYNWNWLSYVNCVYSGGTSASHQNETYVLISPEFTITSTGGDYSFDYKLPGFSNFSVYVLVNGDSSYISNQDVCFPLEKNLMKTSDYVNVSGSLDAFKNQTIRLAFVHTNIQNTLFLDNVVVTKGALCPGVRQLQIDNLQSNNVTFSWNHTSTDNYDLMICSEKQINPESPNVTQVISVSNFVTINNTYTLNSLNPGSKYFIYVRPNCISAARGYGEWSEPLICRTPCIAQNVPYYQNFDTILVNNNPACWIPISKNIDQPSVYNHSNLNTACYRIPVTDINDAFVVLPMFTDSVNKLMIMCRMKASTDNQQISVGITEDITDPSSFLSCKTQVLTKDWENYVFFLDNNYYEGIDYYIGFYSPSGQTENSQPVFQYIDDIEIVKAPTCIYPLSLRASEVTDSAIKLEWIDENSTVSNYTIEYTTAGISQTIITDNNPFVLDGLVEDTDYIIRVRANCALNTYSDYSDSILVSTLESPIHISINSVEYVEDFEDISLSKWKKKNNNQVNNLVIGDGLANSGSNSIYPTMDIMQKPAIINSSAESKSFMYCDLYFHDAGKYKISYDWMGKGDYNAYAKMVLVPPTVHFENGDDWSFLPNGAISLMGDEIALTKTLNEEWNKQITYIDIDSPQVMRVVLYWYNSSSSKNDNIVGIDNFSILPNPCALPTDFTFNSSTNNSASFSWNGVSAKYNMKLSKVKYSLDSIEIITSDVISRYGIMADTTTIFSLEEASVYYAYLQSCCSDISNSDWIGPIQIMTTCDDLELPYEQNFNNSVVNMPPLCWDIYAPQIDMNLPRVEVNSNSLCDIDGSPYLCFISSQKSPVYSIFPRFKNHEINELLLSFKCRFESINASGKILVGYMTDITDENSFVVLDSIKQTKSIVNKQIDLTKKSIPNNTRLVFKYTKGKYGNYNAGIDDLSVKVRPICLPVDSLYISEKNYNSAKVEWDSNEQFFNLEYGLKDFIEGTGTSITCTSNHYVLSGLLPFTSYTVRVQSYLGSKFSSWHEISFRTLMAPNNVSTYFCGFEDEDENNGWIILNDKNNGWEIGSQTKNDGNKSLYVVDKLKDIGYNNSYSSNSWIYRSFICSPGEYELSFDWLCKAELRYDYFQCFLIPNDVAINGGDDLGVTFNQIPDNWITVNRTKKYFSNETNWQNELISFSVDKTTEYKLAFLWKNDAYDGSNPGAQIDNISFRKLTCNKIHSINTMDLTSTTARIGWLSNDVDHFKVKLFKNQVPFYSLDTASQNNIFTNDSIVFKEVNFTNLEPNTKYYMYVKSYCSSIDSSKWSLEHMFTTPCSVKNLPFRANFDSEILNHLPNCWTNLSDVSISVNDQNKKGIKGQSLLLNPLDGETAQIVLPHLHLDEDISNYQIIFYAYLDFSKDDSDVQMSFGQMDILSDNSSYSELSSQIILRNVDKGKWKRIVIPFVHPVDIITGQPKALLDDQFFVLNILGECAVYVDNLTIEKQPTCIEPSNLFVDSIKGNQCVLHWTGSSMQYEVSIENLDNDSVSTQILHSNEDSLLVTSLDAHTKYSVKVRSKCTDSDYSEWTDSIIVITECINESLPLEEDFELLYSNIPICWNQIISSEYVAWHSINLQNVSSNIMGFGVNRTAYANYEGTLTTPIINLDGNSNVLLSFDGWISKSSYSLNYTVTVTSPNSDLNDTIADISNVYDCKRYQIDLSNYIGTEIQINFHASIPYYCPANTYMCLDNLKVTNDLFLDIPSNISLEDIQSTSVKVTLLPDANAISHNVYVIPEHDTLDILKDTPVIMTDSISVVVSNLEPGTRYKVYVQAVNGLSKSLISNPVFFMTNCVDAVLPLYETFDTNGTKLPNCWFSDSLTTISSNILLSGTNVLCLNPGNKIVTPRMIENVNTMDLYLYIYSKSNVEFGVCDNIDNIDSSFIHVKTISPELNFSRMYHVNFSNVLNGYHYIVIKNSSDSEYVYLDNIQIVESSNCKIPEDIEIVSLSNDSASFKIIAESSNFEIKYGPTEKFDFFNSFTQIDNVNEIFSIMGLNPRTSYTMYLRSLCGTNDKSAWYGPILFKSNCGITSIEPGDVYEEDFSSYKGEVEEGSKLPECWSSINSTNTKTAPFVYVAIDKEFDDFFYNYNYFENLKMAATVSDSVYVIFPDFAHKVSELLYSMQIVNYNNPKATLLPTIEIGVMSDIHDEKTFVVLDEIELEVVDKKTYSNYFLDLRYISIPLNSRCLAIRLHGSSTPVGFDCIKFEMSSNEVRPKELNVFNIFHNRVDFTLKCPSKSSNYELVVSNPYLSISDTLRNLNCNDTLNITNLIPSTTYNLKARSFYNNGSGLDTTSWSDEYVFSTYQVAANIPYYCGFEDEIENRNWTSLSKGLSNFWTVNTGFSKEGNSCAFVSNDSINPVYSNMNTFTWIYRMFDFDRGNYDISFYAKAGGDLYRDYLRVFLIPIEINLKSGDYYFTDCSVYNGTEINSINVPDRFIEITEGAFNQKDWTQINKLVSIENPGKYRLAFLWINDNNVITAPSAIIDSVVVAPCECISPIDLNIVDIGTNDVTVTSSIPLGDSLIQIRYIVLPVDSVISNTQNYVEVLSLNNDTVVLDGLDPSTKYSIYASQICDNIVSKYSIIDEFITNPQSAAIPYTYDFDNKSKEVNSWRYINDSKNQFVIDTATAFSNASSLYISNDNGITNSYTKSLNQRSFVYRTFDLDIGEYAYSFNWKCNGEYGCDYGYMFVIPTSVDLPSSSSYSIGDVSISYNMSVPSTWHMSNILSSNYTWTECNGSFNIAEKGEYYVIYMWVNDGSSGYDSPLAIDDFELFQKTCSKPILDILDIESDRAEIRFISDTHEKRVFVYSNINDNYPTLVLDTIMSDSIFMLKNLIPNTQYKVFSRVLCSENDSSDLSDPILFTTDCQFIISPYVNNFDVAEDLECWKRYEYSLNSDTVFYTDLIPSEAGWACTNGGTDHHLINNIWSFSKNNWYISPTIIVSSSDVLSFQIAFTDNGNMNIPENIANDNEVAVMISNDNGNTWTSLQIWNQNLETKEKLEDLSNEFTYKSYKLTSQQLDTIKIAFYASSTVGYADNDVHIDNLSIRCQGDSVYYKDNICKGSSYNNYGFNITAKDVANKRYTTIVEPTNNNCSYVALLDLTVNESYEEYITDSICKGHIYKFGSYDLLDAGEYINTLTTVNGCDSIVHLKLDVIDIEVSYDTLLCEGQIISFGNNIINSAGIFRDTVINSQGCDSITELTVSYIPKNVNIDISICEGDFYDFGHQQLTDAGTYTEIFKNSLNCDSIVTVNLSVIERNTYLKDRFCKGSNYNFRGHVYNKQGVYKDTVENYNQTGCMHVFTLDLQETKPDSVFISDQFCEGDVSYNNFGFGINNPETKNYYATKLSLKTGCDSVVILQLSEIKTINVKDSLSVCDGDFISWGGKEYGSEGIYSHVFTSFLGCDSIVEMNLTVNPSYEIDIRDTISIEQLPYVNLDLNVPTSTLPGDYQYRLNGKTSFGCDSIVNLDLHITEKVGLQSIMKNELSIHPTSVKVGEFVYVQMYFTDYEIENMTVYLYNSIGKIIKYYHPSYDGMKFIMPKVPGIYYLQVLIEDGRTFVGKVSVY